MAVSIRTFEDLQDFALLARAYREERRVRPDVPAQRLLSAIRRCSVGDACSMDEALCPGHEFVYTGTQYGGDDARWGGEGRCYCVHCGLDGDA